MDGPGCARTSERPCLSCKRPCLSCNRLCTLLAVSPTSGALHQGPNTAARRGHPWYGPSPAGRAGWRARGRKRRPRPPTLPIYDCALQQLVSELEPGLPLRKPATAKRRPEPGVGRSGGPWRRSTTLQSAIQNSNRPRLLGIRGLDAAESGIDTRGPGEDLAKETAT